MVLGQWDDQQWLRNFHMQKRTFMELCAWLTPALQRDTTRLRAPNPIKKRVSIAVWKLATTDSYRSVAHQFGVGRSTVGIVMMEVVHAINDILLPRVIHLRDVDTTIAGFAALGFPNCGGVLDATHIPVWAPEHRAAHFMNRKGYCSIVLQALVDHWGRFLDIYASWSGSAHDARILCNSGLFHRLEAGTYFPRRESTVRDVPMPICVIGDVAYPLLTWLMRPYMGRPDQNRARFNDRLNRACNQVELAFGRLKVRFWCLLTCLEMGERNATEVVVVCCVLHNIVERSREVFLPA
uniref:DDE Tnp4 domain-containing protein n=1 Tax=Pelodiscus sinensis TaxID=13735 RepID=K7G002_PELSI